ncbi:TetR/AcrR family transcriptional regulator [Rhodococcus sp. HNM0563]|uniref:TetR/AcrR family transcriptional regulator n=1 Tax=unclassified Rhodococcus (in: high G+C Gram-positive bacteria) TaxID=192944 RepID=UPI00146C3D70|nr:MULTISPECIES: TetR/AcrR family transcriptional regulator [unclassified Rhodococcus (in: high G+C Gram-positive bacteria)]MCK0089383.1 WHG domain-containing protein [Rhodococcus sp. F64268]NLU62909.1 TetR/AcrR family transcriptional regulator [Rhodococcus sp. HNM0563]
MARDNSRPVRRRTLTRDKVIDAAIDAVDEAGWEQLSMSTLSSRLGIVAASLYNHVRGLDDVRAAVQARAMTDLGRHLRDVAMGRSGRDGLRALIDAHRAWATAHPRRYQALTSAPVDRESLITAGLDANGALGSMLTSCGVPEEHALEVTIGMFSALHGFAVLESSGFLGDEIALDRIYESVVEGALSHLPAPTPATPT